LNWLQLLPFISIAAVCASKGESGEFAFDEPEMGALDEVKQQAVRGAIEAAQDYYEGLENTDHRYYIVDKFSETDFCKVTPGGMMGHRYLT
jgi:hypothetical protein